MKLDFISQPSFKKTASSKHGIGRYIGVKTPEKGVNRFLGKLFGGGSWGCEQINRGVPEDTFY